MVKQDKMNDLDFKVKAEYIWRKLELGSAYKINEAYQKNILMEFAKEIYKAACDENFNKPESKEVECYGDKVFVNEDYYFINDAGQIYQNEEGCCRCNDFDGHIPFHNAYHPSKNLTQQTNYQKIINRMWQLAYELNPKDWTPDSTNRNNESIYYLYYSTFKKCWVVDTQSYVTEPLPCFKTLEDAKKAANDLNAKGYKL